MCHRGNIETRLFSVEKKKKPAVFCGELFAHDQIVINGLILARTFGPIPLILIISSTD